MLLFHWLGCAHVRFLHVNCSLRTQHSHTCHLYSATSLYLFFLNHQVTAESHFSFLDAVTRNNCISMYVCLVQVALDSTTWLWPLLYLPQEALLVSSKPLKIHVAMGTTGLSQESSTICASYVQSLGCCSRRSCEKLWDQHTFTTETRKQKWARQTTGRSCLQLGDVSL